MTKYVRVRIGATEKTVSAAYAQISGLTPLEVPAVDPSGRPLPDSQPQPDATAAEKATAPRKAAAKKSSGRSTPAKKTTAKKAAETTAPNPGA